MKYDLSIIIPARNEEFLSETIEDLLKNKRGRTEIIAILDGAPPMKPIADHEDLTLVILPESIGQRASQNLGVKLSQAKWVMKLDAHCSIEEGMDVKMLDVAEKLGGNVALVPTMRNMHIFDWVCENCGLRTYQGPKPIECNNEICPKADGKTDGGEGHKAIGFKKEIVWIAKKNPQSSAYRFNKNLRFKYFPELRSKLPRTGLQETMSLQGSCFMVTRQDYWDKELCDEGWGSWGMQGSEVALKMWLSGGQVLCNLDTYYGHLFRTQTGFSFPYPQSGRGQHDAIKICQDIFLNNKWDKQTRPLNFLLNKFWFALKDVTDPDAKWEESDLDKYDFTK